MKNFIVLLMFITVIPAKAGIQPNNKKLKSLLSSLQTMQANFTQTTTNEGDKESQIAKGKMALSKPGKFRWETTSPNQQLILADGQWIWIYDKDLEQATKQQQETTNSNNPALFLSGDVSNLDERFNVTHESDHFKLAAKSEEDMFQSMGLFFKDVTIQKMVVKTRLGQISEFVFSNTETNTMLPNDLFNFTPPKGTDIIKN